MFTVPRLLRPLFGRHRTWPGELCRIAPRLFHVHGVHFEVLSRGGARPTVLDQGLKDTVLVQEPVELLVRFTQPAVAAPFMYHCHILEHEDSGMMGQYATD